MAKIQRLGRNSAIAAVAAAGEVTRDVPLPEGVILRDEQEMVIWRQFTHARLREDWRDLDLILLAKAVRVESDIRKHQEKLDRSGPIIMNQRGAPIPNPLISIIDTLQRMQLAIIRSLSLAQTETDPRTKNAAGFAQTGFRSLIDGTDDLIAR
jgi:hypothetical protein